MKTLILLSIAAALLSAQPPQTSFPDETLYNAGIKAEQSGRIEQAKLMFLTLAATYDTSPLVDKSKIEIGALYLFAGAQTQLADNQPKAAFTTFATIARAYPESPLSKLANAQMDALDPKGDWKRIR